MPIFLSVLFSRAGLIGMAIAAVLGVILVQTARLGHANATIAKFEAAQKIAKADVATHEATAAGISSTSLGNLQKTQTAIAARFAPLKLRIPLDVTDQDDHDCRVPAGFISLWNAGAASPDAGVPPSAG